MRKFHLLPATVAVATAFMVMWGASPALPQAAVQLVVVDVAAVAKGYRVSKLTGAAVYNDQKERIGSIEDIILNKDRAAFAVLQVGGFLGVGGRLVAIPYDSLNLDNPDNRVVLPGASKDELKKLPEFKFV